MLHQVVLWVLDALQKSWDGYNGLRDSKNNKICSCSCLLSTGLCLTSPFPALRLLKINREVLVAKNNDILYLLSVAIIIIIIIVITITFCYYYYCYYYC